jgi:hypothetical protein
VAAETDGLPETNDLLLQLRKRKISKIILDGILAKLCVEPHLCELLTPAASAWIVSLSNFAALASCSASTEWVSPSALGCHGLRKMQPADTG